MCIYTHSGLEEKSKTKLRSHGIPHIQLKIFQCSYIQVLTNCSSCTFSLRPLLPLEPSVPPLSSVTFDLHSLLFFLSSWAWAVSVSVTATEVYCDIRGFLHPLKVVTFLSRGFYLPLLFEFERREQTFCSERFELIG